jgi:hypothetical protein
LEQSQAQRVTVATIATWLRKVLRPGVRPARLSKCPELLTLRAVRERSGGSTEPDALAFGLESVLLEALDALGEGPRRQAARLLFGVVPGTSGQLLNERRRMAAQHLGKLPSTFRRNHEAGLLLDVAAEIYRIEFRLPRRKV